MSKNDVTKKKRCYTHDKGGFAYCRKESNPIYGFGERYERTPIKQKLPELGTKIVLLSKQLRNARLGDTYYYETLDDDDCPRIMTVRGYSKGIEQPLSTTNLMICTFTVGQGYNMSTSYRASDISIGLYLYKEVQCIKPPIGSIIDLNVCKEYDITDTYAPFLHNYHVEAYSSDDLLQKDNTISGYIIDGNGNRKNIRVKTLDIAVGKYQITRQSSFIRI